VSQDSFNKFKSLGKLCDNTLCFEDIFPASTNANGNGTKFYEIHKVDVRDCFSTGKEIWWEWEGWCYLESQELGVQFLEINKVLWD